MVVLTYSGDDNEETSCPDLHCEQVHAQSHFDDGGPDIMKTLQPSSDAIDIGERHGSSLLGRAGF
jgi:hypothetical protein